MIFSNEGITQVGGDPLNNILELAQILKTIRLRAKENGSNEELANTMIVLAGKLSTIDDEQQNKFINSLPQGQIDLNDMIHRLNIFLEKN